MYQAGYTTQNPHAEYLKIDPQMISRVTRRFADIVREDGWIAGLQSVRRYLGDCAAIQYYLQIIAARIDPNRVHPWQYIWIDPNDVEWSYKATARHGNGGTVIDFDTVRDAGRIVGGDWDQRVCVKYDDLPKTKAIHERFTGGVSWEETGLLGHLQTVIEERGQFDGCETYEELQERYRQIDRLYENISENGYKSRRELCDTLDYRGYLNMPKIHIARDGTFIHAGGSGNHRIGIGQVLDIPIEARVVVRHERWQHLRNEIKRANAIEELSDPAREALTHPDVEHLVPPR